MDAMAVWSLVCGIVGIVLCFGILGPVAVFLGYSSRERVASLGLKGAGVALAGMVLGVIGSIELLAILLYVIVRVIHSGGA
jgi:hypothetical protein